MLSVTGPINSQAPFLKRIRLWLIRKAVGDWQVIMNVRIGGQQVNLGIEHGRPFIIEGNRFDLTEPPAEQPK